MSRLSASTCEATSTVGALGPDRTAPLPPMPRFLTYAQLRSFIPYTRQHLGRLERDHRFPRRVALGPGRVAWPEDEVRAWLEARKAERGGCAR